MGKTTPQDVNCANRIKTGAFFRPPFIPRAFEKKFGLSNIKVKKDSEGGGGGGG